MRPYGTYENFPFTREPMARALSALQEYYLVVDFPHKQCFYFSKHCSGIPPAEEGANKPPPLHHVRQAYKTFPLAHLKIC